MQPMKNRGASMARLRQLGIALCVLTVAAAAGPNRADAQLLMNGAGATFPYPIYSKWFDEYTKVDTAVRFNYQSIGSGGGIRQISERHGRLRRLRRSDDGRATQEGPGRAASHPHRARRRRSDLQHSRAAQTLRFTGDVLADIFLGKITKWNDGRITALNPGVSLPTTAIIVVHRSDGSGTTYIWVDYLSKVSKEWEQKVGRGTSVNWPVGLGGKGNEGVAGQVKNTPGALGYVELAYAITNKLAVASVKNPAGKFVEPTIESTTAAAAGAAAKDMPADFRVSLTNAPGDDAYPIASFTWLLVYREQTNETKGKALVKFLWWATARGAEVPDGPPLCAASGARGQADRGEDQADHLRRAAAPGSALNSHPCRSGRGGRAGRRSRWPPSRLPTCAGRRADEATASSASRSHGRRGTAPRRPGPGHLADVGVPARHPGLRLSLPRHLDVGPGGRATSGRSRSSTAPLVSSASGHADRRAARSRRRDLPGRAVAPVDPAARHLSRRAARGHSQRRLRAVGHLRAGARGSRSWSSRSSVATPGFLPLFQGPPYGIGMLAAGLILAIMVVPFITSVSREVLRAVPDVQREAALGLGATRWETTRIAVLTYGRSGLVGADSPRSRARPRRDDGRHHGDREPAGGRGVPVRPRLHHGQRDRQRVHRGDLRPLPRRRWSRWASLLFVVTVIVNGLGAAASSGAWAAR